MKNADNVTGFLNSSKSRSHNVTCDIDPEFKISILYFLRWNKLVIEKNADN